MVPHVATHTHTVHFRQPPRLNDLERLERFRPLTHTHTMGRHNYPSPPRTLPSVTSICSRSYIRSADLIFLEKIRPICNSSLILKFPFTPRIYFTTQSDCEVSSKVTVKTFSLDSKIRWMILDRMCTRYSTGTCMVVLQPRMQPRMQQCRTRLSSAGLHEE